VFIPDFRNHGNTNMRINPLFAYGHFCSLTAVSL
jgi:hypothetical protein